MEHKLPDTSGANAVGLVTEWGCFLSVPRLFSQVLEPWFVRGSTPDCGMQMREENPGGHPEESAGSGDKDLENRNTRGGAWSGDVEASIPVPSMVSRLVAPSLKAINVTQGGVTLPPQGQISLLVNRRTR